MRAHALPGSMKWGSKHMNNSFQCSVVSAASETRTKGCRSAKEEVINFCPGAEGGGECPGKGSHL